MLLQSMILVSNIIRQRWAWKVLKDSQVFLVIMACHSMGNVIGPRIRSIRKKGDRIHVEHDAGFSHVFFEFSTGDRGRTWE